MEDNLGKKKSSKLGYYIGIALIIFLLGLYRLIFLQNFSGRSKAADEPLASFVFVPNNIQSVAANAADVPVNLKINLQTPKAVQFYKTVITFDKTKLQVKANGINYHIGTASATLDADRNETVSRINIEGKIIIMGELQGSPQALIAGTHSLVSVNFTATPAFGTNKTRINVDTTSQSFIKTIRTDNIIETVNFDTTPVIFYVNEAPPTATSTPTSTVIPLPTATATPGPTNTPIPNGSVGLTFKLKFQGILSQPKTEYNSMEVRIKLGKSDGTAQTGYKTATFSADLSGVWTNSAPVVFENIPVGTGYKVYIKGPKHLQKKICDAAPLETASGTYHCESGRIALANGANTLDFSKVYQLVGDLPVQNSIVDSYDISLIRNNLGKTDADILKVADLNLDGKVDSQDYSLLISALSTRFDEGESQ